MVSVNVCEDEDVLGMKCKDRIFTKYSVRVECSCPLERCPRRRRSFRWS